MLRALLVCVVGIFGFVGGGLHQIHRVSSLELFEGLLVVFHV